MSNYIIAKPKKAAFFFAAKWKPRFAEMSRWIIIIAGSIFTVIDRRTTLRRRPRGRDAHQHHRVFSQPSLFPSTEVSSATLFSRADLSSPGKIVSSGL